MKNTPQKISLVVPVYNEEENLLSLFMELRAALAEIPCDWEVIFVDDGSTDSSLIVIRELTAADDRIRFVAFAKNCGQSAAFAAGFQAAQGQAVVTLDADMQNDPADIPVMLAAYIRNLDVDMVIGWRVKRQDSLVKRYASRFANWVRNTVSRETVRDTGCSLKIMRTDMLQRIPMFTGMHRFLPTLMKLEGAQVLEMPVNHRPRSQGVSKYGIWDRAWASAYDLLAVRWMQKRYIKYVIAETNNK